MGRGRPCLVLALVAGSTACTALLGATDVPDPASGSGADANVRPDAQLGGGGDTGAFDAGSTSEDGTPSSGSSGGSSGSSGSSSGSSASGSSSSGSSGGSTSGSSGSGSGGADSGSGDDSGCGPLDSTSNCGACGVVCSGANAAASTCGGTSCAYTCASGWGDCNASTSPDTDGCETPTTTAQNCGACGVACDVTTGEPSCVGTACTYACNQGHLDCNAASGPNTDGCECMTPACCGTRCQTTHNNGIGQSFYDCGARGTYNEMTAHDACAAYAASVGGDPNACSGGWLCNGSNTTSECYAPGGMGKYCWNYSGLNANYVTDFNCPANKVGTWD